MTEQDMDKEELLATINALKAQVEHADSHSVLIARAVATVACEQRDAAMHERDGHMARLAALQARETKLRLTIDGLIARLSNLRGTALIVQDALADWCVTIPEKRLANDIEGARVELEHARAVLDRMSQG